MRWRGGSHISDTPLWASAGDQVVTSNNFIIVTFDKNVGSGIWVLIFKNRVVAGMMPGKSYFFLPKKDVT